MSSLHRLLFARTESFAAKRRALLTGFAALVVAAMALSESVVGQATSVENVSAPNGFEPLTYRHVFVPAEDAEAWPLDGQKFIPIDARELQNLILAANRTGREAASRATIAEAVYSGQMEGAGIVAGRGTWRIELRGESSAILPLGNLPFMIRDAHWRDESKRPARLGFWGRSNGQPDILGLDVPYSGLVEFSWQVELDSTEAKVESGWRLPPAASSRLLLDLRASHRPLVEGGVILEGEPQPEVAASSNDFHRWEIVLGGSPNAKLRIVSAGSERVEQTPEIRLRDEVAYRLDERGANIMMTLRCEGAISRLRELVVPLPEGVQFISAEADGTELAWQMSTRGPDAAAAVVVETPKSVGDRFSITLRAWHPLPAVPQWRLPSLRPEGMLWISGTFELSLSPSLELQRLSPVDCVQTGVVQSLDDGSGAETHWFTAYSPTAGLELSVDRREPNVSARLDSSLSISESEIDGRLTTQLEVTHGSVHKLAGELAKGWIVESIESIPDDTIGEWIAIRRDGTTEIEIQLAKSPNPRRAVTVRVDGRLEPTIYAEPISSATLRMVRWHGVDVTEHLLSFQAAEPYAVEPIGVLPATTSKQLVAEQNTRAEAADSAAFDLTHAPETAGLRIVLERGEFEADISLDAEFVADEARLSYQLVARPVKSRIDRLLVFANSPLGDDLRWVDRESGATLSAERLATTDAQQTGYPDDGELWLVRLPQPATRPVEIVASQTLTFSSRQQLPLVSLPRALEQRGRIHVTSDAVPLPILEQTHLQPIPVPVEVNGESRADRESPVIGAYRYNPADCTDPARCPRLWMAQRDSSPKDGLVAQRAHIESYFSADGRTAHQAIYHLEPSDQAEILLPVGAENATASLDSRPLLLTQSPQRKGEFSFRVPKHEGKATLQIQFRTRQAALSTGAELQPPVLDNLAILSGDWKVWLPAEFEATSSSPWQADEMLNWRRRLFGPFGRPASSKPFDPLRAGEGDKLAPIAADPTDGLSATSPAFDLAFTASLPAGSHTMNDGQGPLDGWRAHRTTFVANAPKPFVVGYPPATTALTVALFLLCLAAGRRIADWHRVLFVALMAAAAGLALVLPAAQATLATGGFLGLAFSLVAIRRPSFVSDDSPTKTWNRFSATGATAMAIAALFAESSPAQPPQNTLRANSNIPGQVTELDSGDSADENAPASTIHRVLIPTDARGQAVGSKHYVDETFLRQLYELVSDHLAARDWLLIDVTCEGELAERAEPREIVAGQWKLILEIDVLARDTKIVLPLRRDEATWQLTASLDGLPAAIQWHADGHSCTLKIADPGRYSLAFAFAPDVQRSGNRNQIDLSVPAIPGGRFQLRHPVGVNGLELIGVATTGQPADSPKSFEGKLDGSGRVTARWLPQPESEGESPGLRVTELQWLHVGQDHVELNAKFIVEGGVRRPEVLTVAIDGPWTLIASGDVISDKTSPDGSGRIVRVALPPDDIDRQEVHLQWELDDSRLLGLVLLPTVKLELLPVAQRWIALSSDPALSCEFVGSGKAALGTVEEFQALWGDALDTEHLASVIANPKADHATTVSVRPRLAEPSIREVLHVAAGIEGLHLQYRAEVDPGEVAQFQTSLFVSDEVRIQDVTMTRAGQNVPVRWSRTENNAMSIFFSEAMVEGYRLNVEGHVPADGSGEYKVPQITSDSAAAVQRVEFYREDNALLEMRGFNQTDQPDNRTAELPTTRDVRFAGAYQLGSSSFAAGRLVVTPNNVRAVGQTLTSIERDSDAWWGTFICRFVVERGELGILKLRAPATWSGPLDLQSDVPAAVEQQDFDTQQRLVIVRFTDPVVPGKVVGIRLRGRLSAEATTLVAVPNISMETEFRGQHYVVVPSSVDSQAISWTERGVQPTELPPDLHAIDPAATQGKPFEITSRPFRMLLQPLTVGAAAATVRLADTLVTTGPFGGQLTVTHMVVVSRGLSECQLALPPNQQLVRVSSEGRPAFTRQLGERRWLVPLGAANLPQFLEIVTRSSSAHARNDSQIELFRPALLHDGKSIPVEVSLWSVGFPARPAQPSIAGAAAVSAAEQAALRLGRLTSIAESATRSAIELPLPDGRSWYIPWAKRLDAFRQAALETVKQVGSDISVHQVDSAAEEQLADAAERVDAWLEQCDQIWSVPEAEPPASAPTALPELSTWALAQSSATEWTYCVAEGDAARLVVGGLPSDVRSHAKLGGLFAIFAIAASAIAIMRWPAGQEFICRWPHGIAFLVGLAYWAFLWPSVVGLLIAAGSVWLALRPGWPGRSTRLEGSTVIRREHGARSRE